MTKDLSSHREFYSKGELLENKVSKNPFNLFDEWFEETIKQGGIKEANAMTVSTIETNNFPRSRVVLLKYFSEDGFVFFTNYNSNKGKALLKNNKVCLSFFWPNTERQVIIKGLATKCTSELSDKYFNLRPEQSRLGALTSNQSEVIENRTVLESKLKQLTEEYKNKPIKRPEHWGGFIVKPLEIEFWQGRESRLHDRLLYALQDDASWNITRLQP